MHDPWCRCAVLCTLLVALGESFCRDLPATSSLTHPPTPPPPCCASLWWLRWRCCCCCYMPRSGYEEPVAVVQLLQGGQLVLYDLVDHKPHMLTQPFQAALQVTYADAPLVPVARWGPPHCLVAWRGETGGRACSSRQRCAAVKVCGAKRCCASNTRQTCRVRCAARLSLLSAGVPRAPGRGHGPAVGRASCKGGRGFGACGLQGRGAHCHCHRPHTVR